MNKIKYLILSILIVLVSCAKSPIDDVNEDRINLNNPKIGQFNRYLHYSGNAQLIDSIKYSSDTLVLEITGIENNEITIKETVTEGSTFFSLFEEAVFSYDFDGDTIIQNNCGESSILSYFKNISFESKDTSEALYNEWLPEIYGDHVKGMEILDKSYPYLQIVFGTSGSCNCDFQGADALFISALYSKNDFIVRSYTHNAAWGQGVSGWDLIP